MRGREAFLVQSMTTGSSTTQRPGASVAEQIDLEQLRLMYRSVAPGLATGTLVVAPIFAVAFAHLVSWPAAVSWYAALALCTAGLVFAVRRFDRVQLEVSQAPLWERRHQLFSVSLAVIWAVGLQMAVTPANASEQLAMALLAAGMGWATINAMAHSRVTYFLWCSVFVLPLAARLLFEGTEFGLSVGGLLVISWAYGLVFAERTHRFWRETLALRFQNDDLVRELVQERNRAEQARLEAEAANRAKSQFLAAASHDLRQPLQAISLFTSAMAHRLQQEDLAPLVDNIQESVAALSSQFNSLLDLSRLEAQEVKPQCRHVQLQMLLAQLELDQSLVAKQKGLELRFVPCNRVSVYTDPMLLQRILRNLVGNAIRHTEKGRILVGCRRKPGAVLIQVWDTGRGIPEADLPRIFEEFVQLDRPRGERAGGVGLGLSIVDRLARLLGHPLAVTSSPDRGTCFSIEVPARTERPASDRPAPAPMRVTPSGNQTILVIEDHRETREAWHSALDSWGFHAVAVATAGEGLEQLTAAGALPSLIISDYRLGHGITGLDEIERIRAALERPLLPAIIVSGDILDEVADQARAKWVELLRKPVNLEQLHLLIKRQLLKGPA